MLDPKNVGNGEEQYEKFKHGRKSFVQYDYRAANGELFSAVKPTLADCRTARDEWLKKQKGM